MKTIEERVERGLRGSSGDPPEIGRWKSRRREGNRAALMATGLDARVAALWSR